MAEAWTPLPLDKPLFANLDEDAVIQFNTAMENGFVNELGGITRFPGLIERATLADNGRVYLNDLTGDMIAATSKGKVYRIDRRFNVTDVTGVPVSGGRRTIFAKSDRDDLLMAAGGPLVRLRADKTELLSPDAPQSTHVGWIDGFALAPEINSGRWFHSGAGEIDQWDPLDTFSADSNPDNINSMIITPYREVLMAGEDSVEQFERLLTGDVPFFKRWATGDGVKFPYMLLFADNAVWMMSTLRELVRLSGQQSETRSAEIGLLLEQVDNWTDAWIGGYPNKPLHTVGQKFILLQMPNATNSYGTKGITLCYDYRQKRFFSLYGWDDRNGAPARWPGWSHWTLWDKVFVGGEGKIYEVSASSHRNGSTLQRWLVRTSHISEKTELQIKGFRLRVKRGFTPSRDTAPTIQVRCSRDARRFGPWIKRSLGLAGDKMQYVQFGSFGNGSSFQFEISSSSDCPIDLIGADVLPEPIGH